MKFYGSICLCLIVELVLFSAPSRLFAESVRSFESPLSLKLLKEKLEKTLSKIDEENFHREEETEGFAYRYENSWLSPYEYDIYLGTVFASKKKGGGKAIVRIEGDRGDTQMIARILDIEGIINKDSSLREDGRLYNPESKYHIFAQPINLISPSLSVLYQSYNSPRLSKRQTISRSINYLLLDILAYWIGGNVFFTTSHDPKENRDTMLLFFALNRSIGLVQSFNVVRGHNNLLRFGYSFPIY